MDGTTRSDTTRTQAFLHPELETMPREQLAALQLRRLREMLENLYANVPPVRNRMRAAGLRPADVRTLDDVAALPFSQKTDLRDHYPYGLFARPVEQLARLHASSGTTGKSTVVGYTRQDLENWSDLMARSMYGAGVRPGDIVHNAYGYGLFTGGLGAHYGAERLGAVVVPVSGGGTERQVGLIQDFGATVLCATPSYALAIAESAEQQGVDLRQSKLRVGLFGAEPWSAAMRAEIQERLGLKAVDVYGLSEIMGPGVACECHLQQGLHGWEDHFLFEIIDPETGKPAPEGQAGELVITTLTKQALPMLRYRTRDITRFSTERCECGRTHGRILRITGRNDDMLIIRGVNVYPSQLEAVMVGRPHLAPHYQLVVQRRGVLDEVDIEIEAQPGVPSDHFDGLARELVHHIKVHVGISTSVTVLVPGTIARSQGKAVRVRDLRRKEQ
ncbi:phenylacetate--CoA ligase family protein [Ramlibacter montanisoli]|uniref:Phenylacetate-coenzyme A ligase n=1 Tax=Ramlibacter montanisoli TaxID=2732512 RepID=A0A849KM39_9BURK|nr:phenylacetate--CoA ligase [Ramlibacter montanisoli]NNU44983.1 phenylacetate--CoA ligase [Ramlibacter montanisoli]